MTVKLRRVVEGGALPRYFCLFPSERLSARRRARRGSCAAARGRTGVGCAVPCSPEPPSPSPPRCAALPDQVLSSVSVCDDDIVSMIAIFDLPNKKYTSNKIIKMGSLCCCPADSVERAGNPSAARVANGGAAATAAAKRFTIVNRSGCGVWWKAGAGRFMDEPGCADRCCRCCCAFRARLALTRSPRHARARTHAQCVRRRFSFRWRRAPRPHRSRRRRCLSLAVAGAAGSFERRHCATPTPRRVVAARGAPACGWGGIYSARSERRDCDQHHSV